MGIQQKTVSAKHIIPPLSPIAVGICAVTLRFGTCQVAGGTSAKIRILPCSPAYFGTCLRAHQPQPRLANRWLERLAQWVLRLRLAQWVLQLTSGTVGASATSVSNISDRLTASKGGQDSSDPPRFSWQNRLRRIDYSHGMPWWRYRL